MAAPAPQPKDTPASRMKPAASRSARAFKTEHAGLCSNCSHVDTCTHDRRDERLPIFDCEDYGPGQTPTPPPATLESRPAPVPDTSVKGLCSNCDNKDRCTVATTHVGGIWHCELYE